GRLAGASPGSIYPSNAIVARPVNANLPRALTNPLGIANVILGASTGDQFTGNSRDNHITVGAGNDLLSGGGGHDMYFFAGTALGSDTITDGAAASSDTLNFLDLGGPVSLNLSQPVQNAPVSAGNLTLTLTDPNAIANVIGSGFNDTIIGNARDNVLIGAGGEDLLDGAGGNDLTQGGITQVVYLNLDASADVTKHVYTQVERDAIQQRL